MDGYVGLPTMNKKSGLLVAEKKIIRVMDKVAVGMRKNMCPNRVYWFGDVYAGSRKRG